MQIDRSRRNGNHHFFMDQMEGLRENNYYNNYNNNSAMSSNLLLIPSSSSSSSPSNSSSGNGVNFIEHHVSKMDTLAGVAIKYGVEVADIKRMNGLVTDLQMFALKSLHIPLPGRHPPSSSISNGSPTLGESSSDHNSPSRRPHMEVLESLQSLRLKPDPPRVSSAMSTLQGYYGLKPQNHRLAEGTEMSVYRTGRAHYLEDELPPKTPPSRHRKSRSLVNTIIAENTNLAEDVPVSEVADSECDKLIRRRQKADADNSPRTPAVLLKVDNSGGTGFSATAGKGLALRPKSTNRLAPTPESESGWLKPISVGLGDSQLVNGSGGVRKSSSTSNLQEQESNGPSFIWPTSKWNLPTAAINRPIFDGLPKPVTGRRNKAALD